MFLHAHWGIAGCTIYTYNVDTYSYTENESDWEYNTMIYLQTGKGPNRKKIIIIIGA